MNRILILCASVGAGHMRAAQAVELAARELYPKAEVRNVDVLSLTNALFRRIYGRTYLDLVNKAPHMLGYFYDLIDRPRKGKSDALAHLAQRAQLGKLVDLLQAQPWDVIINTHFLPAQVIAGMKRKGQFKVPQVTVTTDFETHRLWVNPPCDRYFTATQEGAKYLESWGVPAAATRVMGIPIHPAFAKLPSREECRRRHGLKGDRPVVLQLAGGFGVGPIRRVHESLLAAQAPLELITVCGRNASGVKELLNVDCPLRHLRHVVGYTDVMHELMAAADVVVSKPGGLTSSEALAAGAAMVIVNPIPGQESRNADYLLENGAAIKANNLATLTFKVQSLLEDAAQLARLKAAANRLAHSRAAYDILASTAELAGR